MVSSLGGRGIVQAMSQVTAARVRSLPSIKHNAVELFMTIDLRIVSEMCQVNQCHLAHTVIKTKCKVQSSCMDRESDRVTDSEMQKCAVIKWRKWVRECAREGAAKHLSEHADNVTMKAAMHRSLVSHILHISQLLKMISLIELFAGLFIWAN